MKLIHHVKKHGKTITLHLKKHHKKYIFGILSATLLWKGVSLIAAYALVHNLSFSFADTVHQGDSNDDGIVVEEIIKENEITSTIETQESTDNSDEEEPGNGIEDETITTTETSNIFESNMGIPTEGEDQTEGDSSTGIEGITELNISNTQTNPGNSNEPENPSNRTNPENSNEPENLVESGNTTTIESDNGNGKCDRGDIEITNPVGGDIVGGTFDISREFKNDDCSDTEYTIKLRTESGQLEIFSGNSENTGFSFDSTQLDSDYYTGYSLTIYGNDTLYREEEGGDFTIDNKAPELSNTGVEYSTRNKKLNIGDTVTVSFESDEELTGVTVNIQGTRAYLDEKNGNKYKYTMEFTENNNTGKIVYGIDYSDIAGNTGYYERYDNIELDYAKPIISNLQFIYLGNKQIKITFNTNESTETNLVYQLSGINITESQQTNLDTAHEYVIQNIKNSYKYNYSISILDEAKNELNIGGIFYISENKANFTNKEIAKSELLTKAGFNSENNLIQNLKNQLNNFGECTNNINIKTLNLSLNKGLTAEVQIPEINNTTINKLTSAFTIVLFERIENKRLEQREVDEITEDLNNFLMVVKLVKDNGNGCQSNMNEYYINRFKKTLIRYDLINN